MEILVGFAGKVLELTVEPIARQFGYVLFYGSNVDGLKEQVEKLKTTREDVRLSIGAAERNCKKIKPGVQDWIRRVDEIIEKKYKEFCQEESRANTGCSYRSCPNLWLRHQISRKAKKMAADVDQLKGEAPSEKVSIETLPKYTWPSSMGEEAFESRISKMKEIMEALANPGVYMIGLHGLGGVGKTTLSKQVAKKAEEEKLFDMVVWVEVKHKPLKEIQSQIADKLGLKFDMQNDDEIIRANLLRKRLEGERSLLLLLDDLWRRLDLDQVGIPFADEGNKHCKIILTSRNENVLSRQMNCKNNIKLELLSEDEALRLFKQKSELCDDSDDPDLLSIAAEVAQECAKLPVAIVAVARALRTEKNPKNWSDALLQLKRRGFRNIPGVDDQVYSSIKLSYDHLESRELKSTFLLLAKLSQHTSISDMLMYCVGLGFLEGVHGMKEARVRLDTLIQQLKASSLLLDSSFEDWFTIHDVVCDVALSIASEEQHALVRRHEKVEWPDEDQLESCTAICLDGSDICERPEELYGPKVEFFLLSNNYPNLRIPESFFKGMQKLKVLSLKNISSLSLSVGLLKKLRMLSLRSCTLENIIGVEHLKKLKILNLSGSEIKQLPCEVGYLVCLQILNLSCCGLLEGIPPNVLSNLKKLEELYMAGGFNRWEDAGLHEGKKRASLVELQHLQELSTLEIDILHASMLPKDLFLENSLETYRISIGHESRDYPGQYAICESSRQLSLVLDNDVTMEYGIFKLLESVEDLCLENLNGITNLCQFHFTAQPFCKLKAIKVRCCDQLKSLFSITMTETLSRIEEIEVSKCESMKDIVAFPDKENVEKGSPMSIIEFPQLRWLKLCELPELTEFCFRNMVFPKLERLGLRGRQAKMMRNGKFPSYPFPNVTYLGLCDDEIVTLQNDLFHGFPNLAAVEVTSDPFEFEEHFYPYDRSVAPVKKLMLHHLGRLEHVWNEQCELDVFLKNPETLEVSNCSRLITLGPSCVSLDNLTNLDVRFCDGLINLLTSLTARTLVQLKNLRIGWCKKIREIITKEEEDVDTPIVFKKLERLTLHRLSSCESFCCHNYTFEFPSLNEVTIVDCFELRIFCSGFLIAPLLEGMKMEMYNKIYYWKDNLNKTIQQLLYEKLFNATLLKIDEYPELMDIWNGKLAIPDHSFNNLKRLVVDKCPFLSYHVIPSYVLTSLVKLEELEVRNCDSVEVVFDLEGINIDKEAHTLQAIPLRDLRLQHLPKLKYVWNKDPHRNCFPHLIEMIAYECESLTSIFPASIAKGLIELRCLTIESCGVEVIVAEDQTPTPTIHFVFPQLSHLDLLKLPNLKNFYPQRHTIEWPCLSTLNVRHCDKLKVFSWEVPKKTEEDEEDEIENQYPLLLNEKVIPKLRKLSLNQNNVKMISNGEFQDELFNEVGYLCLYSFNNDESLVFPYSLLERFPNLYGLQVEHSSFEHIFPRQGTCGDPSIKVPQLEYLFLTHLDRLHNIWNEDSPIHPSLQTLEKLGVEHCSKLINLAPSSASFDNLLELKVFGCHCLGYLLTTSTVKSLVRLRWLVIEDCKMMEEIVKYQGEDVEYIITLKGLEEVKFVDLPGLKSFCTQTHTFEFPLLTDVSIRGCPKMKMFCQGVLNTPLLEAVEVGENEERWEENLNKTVEQLFSERGCKNSLEG